MKKALFGLAVFLSGCASEQQIRQWSSFDLCRSAITGKPIANSGIVWSELNSRRENCQQYQTAIQTRELADQAQFNQGIMLMQGAQPRPIAPVAPVMNPPMNCETRRVGNTAQTFCW